MNHTVDEYYFKQTYPPCSNRGKILSPKNNLDQKKEQVGNLNLWKRYTEEETKKFRQVNNSILLLLDKFRSW